MNVRSVDPRDQTSELDDPAYRVYFWSGDRNSGLMLTSDQYEITGSDVHGVIQWADDHATGRTYSLWVCVPEGTDDGLGLNLVRLAGWDPTASDFSRPAHAVGVPSTASTGLV